MASIRNILLRSPYDMYGPWKPSGIKGFDPHRERFHPDDIRERSRMAAIENELESGRGSTFTFEPPREFPPEGPEPESPRGIKGDTFTMPEPGFFERVRDKVEDSRPKSTQEQADEFNERERRAATADKIARDMLNEFLKNPPRHAVPPGTYQRDPWTGSGEGMNRFKFGGWQ